MLTELRPGDVFYDKKNIGRDADTSLYTVISARAMGVPKNSVMFKGMRLIWEANVLCTPEVKIVGTIVDADDDDVVIVARA